MQGDLGTSMMSNLISAFAVLPWPGIHLRGFPDQLDIVLNWPQDQIHWLVDVPVGTGQGKASKVLVLHYTYDIDIDALE